MSFSDLGLTPELLRAVADKGYDTPSPIQLQAIPAVLAGRDVLAGAQTGTGKTAGFVLPILQRLAADVAMRHRAPRALVLTPTRELAAQVAQSVRDYGKYLPLRVLQVFGGVGIHPQITGCAAAATSWSRRPDGCSISAQQRAADLSHVEVLVLDEADRMLDMGFIHDIKRIIKLLPQRRQNLLFSATYSDDIRGLAERLLADPLSIQVAPRNAPIELVEQRAYRVQKDHKRHLLAHLIREGSWAQVLIFTRTKHGANRLTQQLEGAGIQAAAIHGNKSQAARVRALDMFKRGRDHGAGCHRGRSARPRHQGAAARGELRAPQRSGGLRASHRPHGPGGLFRTCDLAGLGRRAGLAQGHRAAFEAQHPGGRDARIRDCGGAAAAADGAPATTPRVSAAASGAIRGRMAQTAIRARGIRKARASGMPGVRAGARGPSGRPRTPGRDSDA